MCDKKSFADDYKEHILGILDKVRKVIEEERFNDLDEYLFTSGYCRSCGQHQGILFGYNPDGEVIDIEEAVSKLRTYRIEEGAFLNWSKVPKFTRVEVKHNNEWINAYFLKEDKSTVFSHPYVVTVCDEYTYKTASLGVIRVSEIRMNKDVEILREWCNL